MILELLLQLLMEMLVIALALMAYTVRTYAGNAPPGTADSYAAGSIALGNYVGSTDPSTAYRAASAWPGSSGA